MSITITAPESLGDATFAAVVALVLHANDAEGLDLPIPAEVGASVGLLLAHLDGELAGAASISYGPEAEICLCVAPAQRRLGVGRALALAAGEHAVARGSHDPLFVCDVSAESGRAFATALGARLRYAEHRMNLDLSAVPPQLAPLPGLCIRPAHGDDAPALVAILADAFGDPPAMVERFVAQRIASRTHRFLLAEIDGRPAGSLRLVRDGGWVYVTTFGVRPDLHGRGVGRRMLIHAISMLRNEGQGAVRIEVETTNAPALGLYEVCGFRRTHTFAYFRHDHRR